MSSATVQSPATCADDDDADEVYIGAISYNDMVYLQRYNLELRSLIDHLEARESTVPRTFSRNLVRIVIR